MYGIFAPAGLTARSRRLLVLGLLAPAASVWLPSAATAGPNLVANGDLNHTNRDAKVRLGYGDRAAYFTFDGDAHFGRVVAIASGSARTLKDDMRVAYRELSKDGSRPERGLVIDPANSNDAGDVEISVWFDLQGKIRPNTEYEYTIVAVVAGAKTQHQSGFTLVAPAFWADGEAQGAEIEVAFSGHKHNVTGTVRTPDFKQQTGPASMVLKLPPKFKDPLVILRMSLREVDRALIEGKVSPMPVPVRYVSIEDPIAFRISEALQGSAQYLRDLRSQSWGGWQFADQEESVQLTSMIVSALAELGDETDEGPLFEAMEWLAEQLPEELEDEAEADNRAKRLERGLQSTETHAWRLYCLSRYGDPLGKHGQAVAHDIIWLEGAQFDDGGWGLIHSELEDAHTMHSDNDSSALAVTALREAFLAGKACKPQVARRAAKYWIDAQATGGGYRSKMDQYGGVSEATTVTRTAAGVASLLATMDMAFAAGGVSCEQFRRNRPQTEAIRNGMNWLDNHYLGEHRRLLDVLRKYYWAGQVTDFAVEELVGGLVHPAETAFFLQRLGEVSGRYRFTNVDFFQKEAKRLLDWFYIPQEKQFRGGAGPTALALVGLVAGSAPVALQRIIVGNDPQDELLRDAEHLARYLSTAFGRTYKWRSTTIDRPVHELLQVPILYLNVTGDLSWTQAQWNKTRDYCFAGGVLLINIAESNEAARSVIESALRTTFPEYEPVELPADDPILSLHTTVQLGVRPTVIGNGHKNFVFVLAEDWTCPWHTFDRQRRPETFDFVVNLLEYTTDGEPLAGVFGNSHWEPAGEGTTTVPVVRMECGSQTPTYPDFLKALDRTMRANYRTSLEDVSGRDETPTLLWLANVGAEPLTQSQIGLVRRALDGGAYLLAEVAGGDPDRGETFRAELQKIYPRLSVRKLHTSHPIFTGGIEGTQGYDVRRSRLSKTLREEIADEGRCDLYALELEGREVGVLSQYDLSAGVTFMRYPGRRGPAPRAARKMSVNAVLHAMELRVK